MLKDKIEERKKKEKLKSSLNMQENSVELKLID